MGSKVDFADFLQSVPRFAGLESSDLVVLEQAMIVNQYPEGHQFIGEDTRGDGMFLIVEGQVVATHRRLKRRGKDVFERLGSGDLFGVIALIDDRLRWATYRAEGPVTAAFLPGNAFKLLFTANAPVAYHFQELIALQLAKDLRTCLNDLAAAFVDTDKSFGSSSL